MVEKITSYNSASGGSASVVDQVLRRYDSSARLADEFQEHFGAVRASTPAVQYLYDDTAEIGTLTNGGRTHGVVYPNGRVVDYL